MELELIDITRIVYVNSLRENERLLYFARISLYIHTYTLSVYFPWTGHLY